LQDVKSSRIVAAMLAAVFVAAGVAPSRAQVVTGTSIWWGWPGYGWTGPWWPCSTGACIDNPYLRRAIQRELARLEHRSEFEERAQRALQSYGRPPYAARSDWPPPTPESQLQPAYRGSGDIRPEFIGTGQLRQDFAGPQR
jgi:hypothetical protein